MAQDFYSILEVDRNASQDEIKRAYRRLAMKYHPDRNNGDKAAEEKFKEVGAAYDVLGDEEKRRIYDQVGHEAYTQGGRAGGGPGGPGGFGNININFEDLGDIFGGAFGDMFGGGGRRRPRNPDEPRRGADLQYHLTISFEEAVYGTKKTIQFAHDDTCPRCKGSGGEPGSKRVTCKKCGGKGQILTSRGFFQMSTTCPDCGGMGSVLDKPCTECKGRTKARRQREITITIPPGVDTGSRLRSQGNGETGKMGGPNGDLYVNINVRENNIFQRNGEDLLCEVPISFSTAALGGEIEVPTIYGKSKLTIKPGTQNGTEYRMAGMGVQSLTRKNSKGSLYVRVKVEIPVKLSDEQKKKLKEFEEVSTKESYPKWKAFMDAAKSFFSKKD